MRAQLQNAVLAIVFSVLIWAAVGAQLSEVKTIEVDYIVDVPSDVTISAGDRHETDLMRIPLSVDVRGPREVISRLGSSDIRARHEFTYTQAQFQEDVRSGKPRSHSVREDIVPELSGVEILEARPSAVELVFSQVVTWTPVVNKPEVKGAPAVGYRLGGVEIPRDQLRPRVRGPSTTRDMFPGPFELAPIDISGERAGKQTYRTTVLIPPEARGASCDQEVTVLVEIVVEPETRRITFPIRVVHEVTGERVEPLRFAVEPQPPASGWTFPITLRGPRDVLERLDELFKKELLNPGNTPNLPLAYVTTDDFPKERPGNQNSCEIVVIGLPPGVTYEGTERFPIKVQEP